MIGALGSTWSAVQSVQTANVLAKKKNKSSSEKAQLVAERVHAVGQIADTALATGSVVNSSAASLGTSLVVTAANLTRTITRENSTPLDIAGASMTSGGEVLNRVAHLLPAESSARTLVNVTGTGVKLVGYCIENRGICSDRERCCAVLNKVTRAIQTAAERAVEIAIAPILHLLEIPQLNVSLVQTTTRTVSQHTRTRTASEHRDILKKSEAEFKLRKERAKLKEKRDYEARIRAKIRLDHFNTKLDWFKILVKRSKNTLRQKRYEYQLFMKFSIDVLKLTMCDQRVMHLRDNEAANFPRWPKGLKLKIRDLPTDLRQLEFLGISKKKGETIIDRAVFFDKVKKEKESREVQIKILINELQKRTLSLSYTTKDVIAFINKLRKERGEDPLEDVLKMDLNEFLMEDPSKDHSQPSSTQTSKSPVLAKPMVASQSNLSSAQQKMKENTLAAGHDDFDKALINWKDLKEFPEGHPAYDDRKFPKSAATQKPIRFAVTPKDSRFKDHVDWIFDKTELGKTNLLKWLKEKREKDPNLTFPSEKDFLDPDYFVEAVETQTKIDEKLEEFAKDSINYE